MINQHFAAMKNSKASLGIMKLVGNTISTVSAEDGRAAGFQALAEILPRIERIAELVDGDLGQWLNEIMSGLAGSCDDFGLLRDIANLLQRKAVEGNQSQIKLLRHLADALEAKDPEIVLAHIDPDIATGLRKMRGWPEPELKPRKLKAAKKSRSS